MPFQFFDSIPKLFRSVISFLGTVLVLFCSVIISFRIVWYVVFFRPFFKKHNKEWQYSKVLTTVAISHFLLLFQGVISPSIITLIEVCLSCPTYKYCKLSCYSLKYHLFVSVKCFIWPTFFFLLTTWNISLLFSVLYITIWASLKWIQDQEITFAVVRLQFPYVCITHVTYYIVLYFGFMDLPKLSWISDAIYLERFWDPSDPILFWIYFSTLSTFVKFMKVNTFSNCSVHQ